MLRGEEDQRRSRGGTGRGREEKAHSGLSLMQSEKYSIGPSRFQVPSSSQRGRTFARKPPEPLRRAVASCLSASQHPSSEAIRTLQDYLSNPSTVDLAYNVLLEHANAERDRSPPVVGRCVSLLKRYLIRYVPKHAMLQQVDTFCAILIAECSSTNKPAVGSLYSQVAIELFSVKQPGITPLGMTKAAFASTSLVKSLMYVRALVAHHLPSNLLQSTRIAELSNTYSKRGRPLYASYGSSGSIRGPSDDKDSSKSAILRGVEENEDFIAPNVLKWRWTSSKRHQCWTPLPVMTDSGGISRPQVKPLLEFSGMGAGELFLRGNNFKAQKQHGKPGEKNANLDSISDQLLQPSKVTTILEGGSTRSHLIAIAAAKREKSQSQQVWKGDAPKSTWRKRPRSLFQYKHYSEQQALRLGLSEIEEVVSAFCVESALGGGNTLGIVPLLPISHAGRNTSLETSDVAGSVLIKLIIDMYIQDPSSACPLTLSMLEGMLGSSSVVIRTRCFDLLLNLGIHAHLLEPMQLEDHSALEEEAMAASSLLRTVPGLSSTKRGLNLEEAFRAEERLELVRHQEGSGMFKAPVDKVDGATPEAVKHFELWLLQILFEMLLFLVQMSEKEEPVWAAALSCLLYFVSDDRRIQRHRLHRLDIRVVKCLLDVGWEHAWADELLCTLVCMLSNLIYKVAEPVDGGAGRKALLDLEQLELLGGIECICVEYARAKSAEAKASLFSVVIDHVLHELHVKQTLSGEAHPSSEEIQAVVGALCLADAAETLGFALKHGLKNVGEGLFKGIAAAMSRDIDSGRLNAKLLQEVASMFDALVPTFSHPDEEFTELVSVTMASESIHDTQAGDCSTDTSTFSQAWATLNALLHASEPSCRSHGYSWLVDLLSKDLSHGRHGKFSTSLHRLLSTPLRHKDLDKDIEKEDNKSGFPVAVELFYGLLQSKHPVVRRGFTLVLERLLTKCQQVALAMYPSEREGYEDNDEVTPAENWEAKLLELMNVALLQFVSANDTNHINILQMCDVMFSQLCVVLSPSSSVPIPSNTFMRDNLVFNRFGSYQNFNVRIFPHLLDTEKGYTKDIRNDTGDYRGFLKSMNQGPRSSSMASMLLTGQAAAPRALVASIPTALLYWPLLQLAGAATEDMALGVAVGSQGRSRSLGGASDVRAALLVLLIGKCLAQQSAFEEVGGEEFFRSLLDDTDARVAYYTASFLLKRMMSEEPEKYQRVLHTLVFRAQQCNNEKLVENPYLQMRGILQLSNDPGALITFLES